MMVWKFEIRQSSRRKNWRMGYTGASAWMNLEIKWHKEPYCLKSTSRSSESFHPRCIVDVVMFEYKYLWLPLSSCAFLKLFGSTTRPQKRHRSSFQYSCMFMRLFVPWPISNLLTYLSKWQTIFYIIMIYDLSIIPRAEQTNYVCPLRSECSNTPLIHILQSIWIQSFAKLPEQNILYLTHDLFYKVLNFYLIQFQLIIFYFY